MGMGVVTELGMRMGRNGNWLHGNGREWECEKPFPHLWPWEVLQFQYSGWNYRPRALFDSRDAVNMYYISRDMKK